MQQIIEIIAVTTAFLSVYFSVSRNMLLWVTGVISQVTYFLLFAHLQLYGDAFLQVIFLGITLYGWMRWHRQHGKPDERQVSMLTAQQQLFSVSLTLLGLFSLYYFLKHHTNDPLPFFDALITACSITGQTLLCFKKLENWYYWLITNIVSVGVYAEKGIYLSALLYIVLIAIVLKGLYQWHQSMKNTALTVS